MPNYDHHLQRQETESTSRMNSTGVHIHARRRGEVSPSALRHHVRLLQRDLARQAVLIRVLAQAANITVDDDLNIVKEEKANGTRKN